jgi:uncharacterized repeat protein (TIGR01451 family)
VPVANCGPSALFGVGAWKYRRRALAQARPKEEELNAKEEELNAETAAKGLRRSRLVGMAGAVLAVLVLMTGPGVAAAAIGPTDLVLTKSDSADPAVQGDNFTYTIQVLNQGANDASAVVVTDTLPSRVSYVSSSATAGSCQRGGSTVTCDLGQVNAGVTVTASIVVKAQKKGTASNTASLTSVDDSIPATAANNQDTEATVINKKPTGKKPKGKASCAAPTISGTAGSDTLVGTAGADVIRAFAGNDQLFGGGGNDLICADRGADRVIAGSGGDTVIGGPGNDRLIGGSGRDLLKGKSGRDRLRGGRSGDFLNGGRGRDSCKGGAGSDTLRRCP